VAEAAVVGRPDELKGQALVAFVTLKGGVTATASCARAHRAGADDIGKFARPDAVIRFADALPKTRSGKIMRRLLSRTPGCSRSCATPRATKSRARSLSRCGLSDRGCRAR
jgi:acyl-coenzyme A synthetase/AMP-(fatty) acid ligase